MPSLLAQTTFGLMLSLFSQSALPAQATGQTQAQAAAPSSGDATAPTATAGTQAARSQRPAIKKSKAKKAKKEKKPKVVHVKVERGTLTVDGFTGKAALNYNIPDLHYIYLYVPGSGAVVVARAKFAGATEQKDAFHDHGLTVSAGGHIVELYSERILLSRKPESAWVRVDAGYNPRTGSPVFGYGDGDNAPYSWPGALEAEQETGVANPPPLPRSLLPAFASSPRLVKASAAADAPAGSQD